MGMRKVSDQVLAMRMLNVREHGGYGIGMFLRMNAKRYAFIMGYFSAALWVLALMSFWLGFALVLGMVLGTVLRDLGWVRGTRRTWPFTLKVTDWDLVEELAAEKPPG